MESGQRADYGETTEMMWESCCRRCRVAKLSYENEITSIGKVQASKV